jgi:hypothetical protein
MGGSSERAQREARRNKKEQNEEDEEEQEENKPQKKKRGRDPSVESGLSSRSDGSGNKTDKSSSDDGGYGGAEAKMVLKVGDGKKNPGGPGGKDSHPTASNVGNVEANLTQVLISGL